MIDWVLALVVVTLLGRKPKAPTGIDAIRAAIVKLNGEIAGIDQIIVANETALAQMKGDSQALALACFRGNASARQQLDGLDAKMHELTDTTQPRLRAAKVTARFSLTALERDLHIAEQAKSDADDAAAVVKLQQLAAAADQAMTLAVAAVIAFCDQDDQVMARLMATASPSTPPSPLSHRLVMALSAHLCGARMLDALRSTRLICSVTDARANNGHGFKFVDVVPRVQSGEKQ